MACPVCEVKVEGNFSETLFGKLNSDDQNFLEEYLLASFSIKTLEQNSSLGYAAIRSRLDKLISNYKSLENMDDEKKVILKKLGANEISITEAKDLLEKISGE